MLKRHADSARQSDISCRFGGQEFVVLLPETDKAGASIEAERLRDTISSTQFPGGVSITISVGVATFPEDGQHATEVLARAEDAVKRAKISGRNCIAMSGELQAPTDIANTHGKKFPTLHGANRYGHRCSHRW
ncbi:MAG: GGDEF domain-containing protein [Myxococcales bacterium]|nr:GGDEF domain-containing protein [Myxococcales bacterium]